MRRVSDGMGVFPVGNKTGGAGFPARGQSGIVRATIRRARIPCRCTAVNLEGSTWIPRKPGR